MTLTVRVKKDSTLHESESEIASKEWLGLYESLRSRVDFTVKHILQTNRLHSVWMGPLPWSSWPVWAGSAGCTSSSPSSRAAAPQPAGWTERRRRGTPGAWADLRASWEAEAAGDHHRYRAGEEEEAARRPGRVEAVGVEVLHPGVEVEEVVHLRVVGEVVGVHQDPQGHPPGRPRL